MIQPLRGLDAAFLYFEENATPMHVAQACVFEPSDNPEQSTVDAFKDLIERRLDKLPPFHQVLASVPGQLGRPVWTEDPSFDIDYHLRSAALPSPGGIEDLAQFTSEFIETPLDRSHPLWEMRVVEGLPDGLVAGVTKVHHAAIDGVSGAELTANLLDVTADPDPDPPAAPRGQFAWPSTRELIGKAISDATAFPRSVLQAAASVGTAASRMRSLNRASEEPPPPAPFSAPATPFNAPVSRRRRVAFTELDLGEVDVVRRSFGATINDVVLAVCAGALRTYLDEIGMLPERDLVAAVPISVRPAEAKQDMGNMVSAMLVSLATTVDEPVQRLAAVAAGAKRAKAQAEAMGSDTVAALADLLPPILGPYVGRLQRLLRVLERPRPIFNVMISNFPGPKFPLYCVGAKLVAAYPIGPIMSGAALNITLQSYLDRLFVGVNCDADAVPDAQRLARLLPESLDLLVKKAA